CWPCPGTRTGEPRTPQSHTPSEPIPASHSRHYGPEPHHQRASKTDPRPPKCRSAQTAPDHPSRPAASAEDPPPPNTSHPTPTPAHRTGRCTRRRRSSAHPASSPAPAPPVPGWRTPRGRSPTAHPTTRTGCHYRHSGTPSWCAAYPAPSPTRRARQSHARPDESHPEGQGHLSRPCTPGGPLRHAQPRRTVANGYEDNYPSWAERR